MAKNLVSGPIFAQFLFIVAGNHYVISRKTNAPNFRKWQKT